MTFASDSELSFIYNNNFCRINKGYSQKIYVENKFKKRFKIEKKVNLKEIICLLIKKKFIFTYILKLCL